MTPVPLTLTAYVGSSDFAQQATPSASQSRTYRLTAHKGAGAAHSESLERAVSAGRELGWRHPCRGAGSAGRRACPGRRRAADRHGPGSEPRAPPRVTRASPSQHTSSPFLSGQTARPLLRRGQQAAEAAISIDEGGAQVPRRAAIGLPRVRGCATETPGPDHKQRGGEGASERPSTHRPLSADEGRRSRQRPATPMIYRHPPRPGIIRTWPWRVGAGRRGASRQRRVKEPRASRCPWLPLPVCRRQGWL